MRLCSDIDFKLQNFIAKILALKIDGTRDVNGYDMWSKKNTKIVEHAR